MRQVEAYFCLLAVAPNLWVDTLLARAFGALDTAVGRAEEATDGGFFGFITPDSAKDSLRELGNIVSAFSGISAVGSVIMWLATAYAFMIVCADYQVAKAEAGAGFTASRNWRSGLTVSIVIIVVNVLTLIGLYSVWWPP